MTKTVHFLNENALEKEWWCVPANSRSKGERLEDYEFEDSPFCVGKSFHQHQHQTKLHPRAWCWSGEGLIDDDTKMINIMWRDFQSSRKLEGFFWYNNSLSQWLSGVCRNCAILYKGSVPVTFHIPLSLCNIFSSYAFLFLNSFQILPVPPHPMFYSFSLLKWRKSRNSNDNPLIKSWSLICVGSILLGMKLSYSVFDMVLRLWGKLIFPSPVAINCIKLLATSGNLYLVPLLRA